QASHPLLVRNFNIIGHLNVLISEPVKDTEDADDFGQEFGGNFLSCWGFDLLESAHDSRLLWRHQEFLLDTLADTIWTSKPGAHMRVQGKSARRCLIYSCHGLIQDLHGPIRCSHRLIQGFYRLIPWSHSAAPSASLRLC